MLFIRKLKPSLNVQSDSINAKLFILFLFSIVFHSYSHTYFLLYISSYCLLIIIYTCLILIHFDLRMTLCKRRNIVKFFTNVFRSTFLSLNFLVKCSSKSSERKAVQKKGSKMKSPIWQPSSSFGCQNIFLNSYGNQNDRSLEGCKNVMKTMTKYGYLGCMDISPAGVPRLGL